MKDDVRHEIVEVLQLARLAYGERAIDRSLSDEVRLDAGMQANRVSLAIEKVQLVGD